MRGREFTSVATQTVAGITPAYAGKSFGYASFIAFMWDHPRVCGEEGWIVLFLIFGMGSPPRMRGRVCNKIGKSPSAGITPAYAGKSPGRWCWGCPRWDHPRVCGEESVWHFQLRPVVGSPPRMRGRVHRQLSAGQLTGITPAYAGKSLHPSAVQANAWDHPRVCGEELSGVSW